MHSSIEEFIMFMLEVLNEHDFSSISYQQEVLKIFPGLPACVV